MKVGITGEWIGTRAGGLETYSSNLIHALAKSDSVNQYFIYTAQKSALPSLKRQHANFCMRYLGSSSRWLTIPALLPYKLLRDSADLLHATSIAPLFCPAKLIVTVHDIGFIRQAKYYPRAIRYRLRMLISSGIRRASKIIAVSEYTKRDIANHYGIDENKIEVVHEGVHENYKAVKGSDKTRQVLKRYGIPDQYVLYVGRLHEGKNLIRLLQAYARVRKQGQADYRLVFVGRELFNALPIYREVSRLGLGKEVIFSGYVEGKDLPVIYSHAAAFVYPSLFEGFGLPPLEAMACGTPVLSSSAGSLEEVIGDGGLLFDPCSLDQMTESLDRILRDKSLREDLRQRGFKRASLFSWENAAKKTLKVYQQA